MQKRRWYMLILQIVELQPEVKRLKIRKNNWDYDIYKFDEVLIEFAYQKRVYGVESKPEVEAESSENQISAKMFPDWYQPICIGRQAFGDQYRATDSVIKGAGKLKLVFGNKRHAYPFSKPKKVDWDKLEVQVKIEVYDLTSLVLLVFFLLEMISCLD
ncbi:Kinesin motor domain-containing protein [Forsythia ovata]|uniref:Kinesin motor domain-containing protein n=1 Tax=Forsythia ovata TaxID=205694 RepID=A0ABD1XFC3_9LAMI